MSLFFVPSMTEGDLRRIFREEQTRFVRRFPKASIATLILVDRECPAGFACAPRDYARCNVVSGEIELSKRAAKELTRDNIVAIFRHELGHLVDERIDEPFPEQRADDLAAYVTGERIYYDENDVQTVGFGRYPRPLYLHR